METIYAQGVVRYKKQQDPIQENFIISVQPVVRRIV